MVLRKSATYQNTQHTQNILNSHRHFCKGVSIMSIMAISMTNPNIVGERHAIKGVKASEEMWGKI